jgi:hypothetical protein
MCSDCAHRFILYLTNFLIAASGFMPMRVIMSCKILKGHTPNEICRFSTRGLNMPAEDWGPLPNYGAGSPEGSPRGRPDGLALRNN